MKTTNDTPNTAKSARIERLVMWFKNPEMRQVFVLGRPSRFRVPWSRFMSVADARMDPIFRDEINAR